MTQPSLEVRSKKLIESDGLQFKDLNGNGQLDPYEDWRLSPAERAADLVSKMNLDEKVGLMLINSRFTGYQTADDEPKSHDGILDERIIEAGTSIFATRRSMAPPRPSSGCNCATSSCARMSRPTAWPPGTTR